MSKVLEELGSYIANVTTGGKISNEFRKVFGSFCVSFLNCSLMLCCTEKKIDSIISETRVVCRHPSLL